MTIIAKGSCMKVCINYQFISNIQEVKDQPITQKGRTIVLMRLRTIKQTNLGNSEGSEDITDRGSHNIDHGKGHKPVQLVSRRPAKIKDQSYLTLIKGFCRSSIKKGISSTVVERD